MFVAEVPIEIADEVHPRPLLHAEDLADGFLGPPSARRNFSDGRGTSHLLLKHGHCGCDVDAPLSDSARQATVSIPTSQIVSKLAFDMVIGVASKLGATGPVISPTRFDQTDHADLHEFLEFHAGPTIVPGKLPNKGQMDKNPLLTQTLMARQLSV